MTRRHRILTVMAAAAVAVALVWAFTPRPRVVEVASVDRGAFEQTVDEDGKTRVRERYVVSAPLAGRLQRMMLKAGDPVAPGQTLALLDPAAPPFIDARTERELQERVGAAEATLARARTSVEHARAALAQSEADLRRTRKLASEGFVSSATLERETLRVTLDQRTVEAAAFEGHAAEHQVELARAALLQSRRAAAGSGRAERLVIRSPVRGRVLRIAQESEAVLAIGAPLVELGDAGDLEVVIDVLTADAVRVQPGAPVHLDVGDGAAATQGRVRRVEPSAFTKVSALGVEEQRVNVIVDVVAKHDGWANVGDGYRVDARIVVYRADDVLQVPVGALFRDGERWAVFVLVDGRARLRTVEIARRGSARAAVTSGLVPGERVVVYPGEALRDGARVTVR